VRVRVKKHFAESVIRHDSWQKYPEPMHKFMLTCEVLDAMYVPNHDAAVLYNLSTGEAAVCSGELFDIGIERVIDDS
jgi:hypothetical protein